MSKLVWDAVGERLYETGTKYGVLYPMAADGTYEEGVAWNGLTGVDQNPEGGDISTIYADDMEYLNLLAREKFGATIKAYTYPDEWLPCDGTAQLVAGLTIGQQPRKHFGFCYRTVLGNDTQGDAHGYLLHIVYNCLASPSSKSYQTVNDSPEAIEFSWEVKATPVEVEGHAPTAEVVINSTKIDSDALADIERALYGYDADPTVQLPGGDPYLPSIEDLIDMAGG